MANKHRQKYKERLPKEARERYQNRSEEEKDKRWKSAQERYQNFTEEEKKHNKNLSEGQKQKLVE